MVDYKLYFSKFKKPIKLIFIRGIGSLVYSLVAVACIPSQNFADVIVILPLMEFVSAMLFPVMRTGIIANRISTGKALLLSSIICVILFLYSMRIYNIDAKYLIPAAVTFLLIPLGIITSATLEKISVNKSTSHEVRSALISALGASLLIYLSSILILPDFFKNPLIRTALFSIIFLTEFNYKKVKKSINWGEGEFIRIFLSLRGLDYLLLFSFIKISLLSLLRNAPYGDLMVKALIIIYDISSAFLALFLRHRYSESKFKFKVYYKSTYFVFVVLIVASFVTLLVGFILFLLKFDFYSSFYMLSTCILIVMMAGMTTTVILAGIFDYIILILLLIVCVYVVNPVASFELQIVIYNFLMAILFYKCAVLVKNKKADKY